MDVYMYPCVYMIVRVCACACVRAGMTVCVFAWLLVCVRMFVRFLVFGREYIFGYMYALM